MPTANRALDEGLDRAARLLDVRDEGIRLVWCVCDDLLDLGAPEDVYWRLRRAYHLLTLSDEELQKQRRKNKRMERKA